MKIQTLLLFLASFWATMLSAQQYPKAVQDDLYSKKSYYFVDSNQQVMFGGQRYEWADDFEKKPDWAYDIFATVKIDGQNHLIDTLGNICPIAYDLSKLNEKTRGLYLQIKDIPNVFDEIYKYPQLQYIRIVADAIEIKANGLANFSKLKYLHIYSNEVNINKNSFNGLKNLKNLYISSYETANIHKDAFKNLENLENLGLDNCKLSRLDSNTFVNCTKINNLNIECTELKLNTAIFKPLQNLKYFQLRIDLELKSTAYYQTALETILPNTDIDVLEYQRLFVRIKYDYDEAGELFLMPLFFGIDNDSATIEVVQRIGNIETEAYWLVDVRLKKRVRSKPPYNAIRYIVRIKDGFPQDSDMIPYSPITSRHTINFNNQTYQHCSLHESGIYQFQTEKSATDTNQYIQRFYKHDFEGNLIWKKEINIDAVYKTSKTNYARYFSFLSIDEAGNLYFLDEQDLQKDNYFHDVSTQKNIYCLDGQTGNIIWQKKLGKEHRYHIDDFTIAPDNSVYLLGKRLKTDKKSNHEFIVERVSADKSLWVLDIEKQYMPNNLIVLDYQYAVDNQGYIYLMITSLQFNPKFAPIHVFKISPNGQVIWQKEYGQFMSPAEEPEKYTAEIDFFCPSSDCNIILLQNKLYVYLYSDFERVDLINSALPAPKFVPVLEAIKGLSALYGFVLVFDANTGQLEAGKYLNRD